MRENGGLNFYRNLMKHEVTVDRNWESQISFFRRKRKRRQQKSRL